jgi:hypothetical protein
MSHEDGRDTLAGIAADMANPRRGRMDAVYEDVLVNVLEMAMATQATGDTGCRTYTKRYSTPRTQ